MGCHRQISNQKIDYPMKKIESAIATNNVLLLKDFLLHTENRKEFIYMALDYNSLNVLEFLLHFPKLEEGVANSPYFYVQGKEAFLFMSKCISSISSEAIALKIREFSWDKSNFTASSKKYLKNSMPLVS